MKLLLHICCAPCSVMAIETLRNNSVDVTGFWYNPNIHPFTEYRNRLEALKGYSESIDLKLIIEDFYGLRMFTKNVIDDLENRCDYCYEERLRKTAVKAREAGFDAFSSTLFISPYQKHEQLVSTARRISMEERIEFHYVDFRPYFREGQNKAKKLPLYMQKYCGCIFSEEDRYLKKYSKKS